MMKAVADQPSFKILICLIRLWDANDASSLMTIPAQCDMITEVSSVEISESFTDVIGTAKVKFPKGTVLRKTLDEINAEESVDEIKMSSTGVVEVLKSKAQIARVGDFSVGRRIRIQLGYTTDPAIAALTKVGDGRKNIYNTDSLKQDYIQAMNYTFDGYIVKCGIEEPIEIKCEDLGHMLKKVMCPRIGSVKGLKVNDFLASDGKYKLLEDTGLELLPASKDKNLNIGKFSPDDNMTVYELLTSWSKKKLHSFVVIENDTPYLAVAKSYLTNAKDDSVIKIMEKSTTVPVVDFGYHVANNGLTLSRIDPLFLAVRATGTDSSGKHLHLVLMLNPEYGTNPAAEKYRVVNDSNKSKKSKKSGQSSQGSKVDLKKYTVVDFHSDTEKLTKDKLKTEAIEYFESYNQNGMDGTLTLFGDFSDQEIYTGGKVELADPRQSAKNGVYLIGEVVTRFGVDGYRKVLKLPYCIALKNDDE